MTAAPLSKCPECGGTGQHGITLLTNHATGRAEIGAGICSVCTGTGRVTLQRLDWLGKGRRLREHRMILKLSLNEFAARLGVEPRHLNDVEHGRADPTAITAAVEAAPKEKTE